MSMIHSSAPIDKGVEPYTMRNACAADASWPASTEEYAQSHGSKFEGLPEDFYRAYSLPQSHAATCSSKGDLMSIIVPLRSAVRNGSKLKQVGGLWGEVLAEFLGTFVLISFGDGVVAMAVAALPGSGRTAGPTEFFQGAGDWLLIAWGWALAVAFGVYVAGGVSGAHLNPAVTLAFAVRRKFPWAKVGPYCARSGGRRVCRGRARLLVYHDAIDAFNEALGTATNGPDGLRHLLDLRDLPGAVLRRQPGRAADRPDRRHRASCSSCIAAVIDMRNLAVQANLGPLIIGFAVAAIGMSFGANAGYAINPARDFGPRLWAFSPGGGSWRYPARSPVPISWYFWIPIVGPIIGAIIGIFIYDWFVGDILHARGLVAEASLGGCSGRRGQIAASAEQRGP